MNFFDIIIFGLVLLGALQGYRKGLLTGIGNLIGNILGFVVAANEYITVLNWLEKQFPIRQWVEPAIYKLVLPSVKAQASKVEQQALDKVMGLIPQEWRSLIPGNVGSDYSSLSQAATQNAAAKISVVLTDNVLRIFAFTLVYFVVVLLIQVLVAALLSPLGRYGGLLNEGGGFLFGALSVFVGLSIIAGLLSPVVQIFSSSGSIWQSMIGSMSYPYLVKTYNFLQHFLAIGINDTFFKDFPTGKIL
ncbi:MAG: CvpA family protein [Desulfitobacterium hafniense]|nr:CvpA family protein [Desulfitobacterium hafniense]